MNMRFRPQTGLRAYANDFVSPSPRPFHYIITNISISERKSKIVCLNIFSFQHIIAAFAVQTSNVHIFQNSNSFRNVITILFHRYVLRKN